MRFKTVGRAFRELQVGKALIVADIPHVKQAAVRDVDLAYWEDAGSVSDQPYLQPVYVFTIKPVEGSLEVFSAIVPAAEDVPINVVMPN